MRELSLFTGAGGGVLGSLLLGWQTVGYVEYEDYPQRILKQRMDDGILCQAPIFGDIRAFIRKGYAESYQGMVDVITAGFPCQPFSVAGKQLGADDPRNMWPATIDTIRTVRPRFALLENVPGLLGSGYFGRILGDLAESGYDARWVVFSSIGVGTYHNRERIWVLAYPSGMRRPAGGYLQRKHYNRTKCFRGIQKNIFNRERFRCDIAEIIQTLDEKSNASCNIRNGDDVPYLMDRLKAIGNGQVPIVAATAWKLLTGALQ